MGHILKLKQIREGDIIDSFGGVTVTRVEPGVQHLVDGPNDGVRLTFDREIGPGRTTTTMGENETLLVRNPGNRRPPAYEPPPPPKEGDSVQQWCPLCQREVKMRLGGKLPNHNSNKPGRGTKGYRCEASGKTVEEAKEMRADQDRKYRLLGYGSRVEVPLTTLPAAPTFGFDGEPIGPMPWIKVDRVSRDEISQRFAVTKTATKVCPNCGSDKTWTVGDDHYGCDGCGRRWEDMSVTAASAPDYSKCPECGKALQWGDSEIHTLKPGVWGSPEDYGICTNCGITWTEDAIEEATEADDDLKPTESAVPKTASGETCPGSGEFVHPIVGTNMNGWATNTMQGACPACGERFMGWVLRDGVKIPSHSIPKTALGEQKAPPEVDTLRDEQCPVCGEADAYSGDNCPVCGYIKPPDAFTDPDTAKAKEMDLRKDQADETKLPGDPATEDPANGQAPSGQGLERFRVDGPVAGAPAGATGSGLERFRVATKRDPYAEGQRAGRSDQPNHVYWNPWPKGTLEADLYTKGWEDASGQKRAARTIPRSFDPATADTFQLAMAYEILGERARDAKTETGRSQALSQARKLEEAVRARNLHFVKPLADSDGWLCVNETEYLEIVNNPARMDYNQRHLMRSLQQSG